jgi:hypothetical protein
MGDETYRAALAEYLDRATDDPDWKAVFNGSAERVLGSLSGGERARLMGYIGRFSIPSAAFVVKEMAEVHALGLSGGGMDRSETNLERFRGAFILPPVGAEEGRRAVDAPREVVAAALRLRLGGNPAYRARGALGIDSALGGFADRERGEIEALFAGWPVVAVEYTFRIWMWLSDDAKRAALAGAQYGEWKRTGDERIWWTYFDAG